MPRYGSTATFSPESSMSAASRQAARLAPRALALAIHPHCAHMVPCKLHYPTALPATTNDTFSNARGGSGRQQSSFPPSRSGSVSPVSHHSTPCSSSPVPRATPTPRLPTKRPTLHLPTTTNPCSIPARLPLLSLIWYALSPINS